MATVVGDADGLTFLTILREAKQSPCIVSLDRLWSENAEKRLNERPCFSTIMYLQTSSAMTTIHKSGFEIIYDLTYSSDLVPSQKSGDQDGYEANHLIFCHLLPTHRPVNWRKAYTSLSFPLPPGICICFFLHVWHEAS